ncbi:MAG: methyltransferase domain-containing protein [Acetobacteraceae bacterium]
MSAAAGECLTGLLDRFRCPNCAQRLQRDVAPRLVCAGCGHAVAIRDGVVDFVAGRFGTILDAESYDHAHGIDDKRAEQHVDEIRRRAGARWPAKLGSVIEIGCGTGYLSRVLAASANVSDLILTDVSIDMLRRCRQNLERLGLLNRIPIAFATYSGAEGGLADRAFDTCVGGSVLHHIPDVPHFLSDMQRLLKPGGRAFFIEPNLRYYRATAQILCDILALSFARQPGESAGRQLALNWTAGLWQRLRHQGDIEFLSGLEDKHLFMGDAFESIARDIGFSVTKAIPFGSDPSGASAIGPALHQIGVEEDFITEVLDLMPHIRSRYMDLLHSQDLSPSYLLWLEKWNNTPRRRANVANPAPRQPSDNLLRRHHFAISAEQVSGGISVKIDGWFVSLAEAASIRVVVDGNSHVTPVWRPRGDVHMAVNREGLYPSWHSLCSGILDDLYFPDVMPRRGAVDLSIDAVLTSGASVPIAPVQHLPLGQTVNV